MYAVDWNQGRENVLAGAAWLGGAGAGGAEVIEQLRKPTALICSSKGGDRVALSGGRSKRDELLLDMIKSAASKGGIVLIPTDTSARVLELAYLLEHSWRTESLNEDSPLRTSKLYLASKNIGATMRYTRSMFEWMDDAIVREFEGISGDKQENRNEKARSREGPFDFKHLRLLERKGQIDRILNETDSLGRSVGKVILASDTSMEWGFSKEVLRKISDDRRNLVILTEKMGKLDIEGPPGIARTLWSWWEERRDGVAPEKNANGDDLEQVYAGGREVQLRDARKVALQGNDLTIYQQWLANQRELQSTSEEIETLEAAEDVVDDVSDSSDDSDDESETDQQGKALNISATMGQARKKIGLSDEDLGVNILLRKKGVYDYDVRGKKGREKMFPIAIRRKRIDDFGEVIRPEDYLRADEVEDDGNDPRQGQPGRWDTKDTLGKKRKWDDAPVQGNRKQWDNGGNKRQQMGNGNGNRRDSIEISAIAPGPEDEPSDDEQAEEDVTGPSKVLISTENLSINLRLAFVDFAGLHDKRSLQMLIPLIQPRKLILVSGMRDETLALANDCRRLLAATSENSTIDVYTPEIGIVIDASVDTNSWTVKLTDALVKRLRWQKVKGLGIVTLTGRLEATSLDFDEGIQKKQKLLKGEEDAPTQTALSAFQSNSIPTLDVLPTTMASASRSVAQPLHVGDLRLADLRKLMLASGHTAEFRGEGTLLIDGSVIVRKTGTGRIEVESVEVMTGMMQGRSAFYAVKSKIYEGLAVVAGG